MRRIHRMIALALAALWLPAVVHCGWEMIAAHADTSATCCSHDGDARSPGATACVIDHCEIFDQGHFRAEGDPEPVAAPAMVVRSATIAIEVVLAVAAASEQPRVHPPPELGVRWVFVSRAAPLANAPGATIG